MRLSSFVLLCLMVLSVGCATSGPINLEPTDLTMKSISAGLKGSDCKFQLNSFSDTRLDKDDFGGFYRTAVNVSSIHEILKQSLGKVGLKDHGDASEGYKKIDVSLKKAYFKNIKTSKTINIVIALEFPEENSISPIYVRGNDTSINWSSSQDEFASALNRTLNVLLINTKSKLEPFCQNQQTTL